MIVDPPPVAESTYRLQHGAYLAARDRRDFLSGSAFARSGTRDDLLEQASDEVDACSAAMTPYRAWWREQRSVAALLQDLHPGRALLLFDPAAGDLDLIEAVPMREIGEIRLSTIPNETERVVLCPDDLGRLSAEAWRFFRADPYPAGPHFVLSDEPATWLQSLAAALASNRPLRPGATADVRPETMPSSPGPSEAVLVEAAANVAAVIGVQYAHRRGARLVMVPVIATEMVDAAIDVMADLVEGETDGNADRHLENAMTAIEQAVTAVLPESAVAAVGELPLTAFTAFVPYNFVRSREAVWAEKPIGHIVGNPTFPVLADLYGEAVRQPGLEIVFDTGHIATDETDRVEAILRANTGAPITIRDDASLPTTLTQVTEGVPLDLLYFNTHGTQNGIMLGRWIWPDYKLLRSGLRNGPIVFNNSCRSWAGVGRAFLQMGARGYVGTLWSVESIAAARYAESVLRASYQGAPVAAGMHGSDVDPATARAYCFFGPVEARLSPGAREPQRRLAALRALVTLMETFLRRRGPSPQADYAIFASLNCSLEMACLGLAAEISDLDRLELAGADARIWCRFVERFGTELQHAREACASALAVVAQASAPERRRKAEEVSILFRRATAELTMGRAEEAVTSLLASIDAAAAAGDAACDQHLLLCDAYRMLKRPTEAMSAAGTAFRIAGATEGAEHARLIALGRITQLYRGSGRNGRALQCARIGAARATSLAERAIFKCDETRALIALKRWPEALDSARAAVELSRLAYSERPDLDLSAIGLLAHVQRESGQNAEARDSIEEALRVSRQQRQMASVGDFLLDLAKLRNADQELASAVDAGLEAAEIFAALRDMRKLHKALGMTADLIEGLRKLGHAAAADSIVAALRVNVALLTQVPADLRFAMRNDTCQRLLQLLEDRQPPVLIEAVSRVADTAEAGLRSLPQQTERAKFIETAHVVTMLRAAHAIMVGEVGAARAVVRAFDKAMPTGDPAARFLDAALSRSASVAKGSGDG